METTMKTLNSELVPSSQLVPNQFPELTRKAVQLVPVERICASGRNSTGTNWMPTLGTSSNPRASARHAVAGRSRK